MNLFIKERGAWQSSGSVGSYNECSKKTEHTFCVKHFVIELFFISTNMTFGFPVVSHISNKSLTLIPPCEVFFGVWKQKLLHHIQTLRSVNTFCRCSAWCDFIPSKGHKSNWESFFRCVTWPHAGLTWPIGGFKSHTTSLSLFKYNLMRWTCVS